MYLVSIKSTDLFKESKFLAKGRVLMNKILHNLILNYQFILFSFLFLLPFKFENRISDKPPIRILHNEEHQGYLKINKEQNQRGKQ
jgi:hypothetical protein